MNNPKAKTEASIQRKKKVPTSKAVSLIANPVKDYDRTLLVETAARILKGNSDTDLAEAAQLAIKLVDAVDLQLAGLKARQARQQAINDEAAGIPLRSKFSPGIRIITGDGNVVRAGAKFQDFIAAAVHEAKVDIERESDVFAYDLGDEIPVSVTPKDITSVISQFEKFGFMRHQLIELRRAYLRWKRTRATMISDETLKKVLGGIIKFIS